MNAIKNSIKPRYSISKKDANKVILNEIQPAIVKNKANRFLLNGTLIVNKTESDIKLRIIVAIVDIFSGEISKNFDIIKSPVIADTIVNAPGIAFLRIFDKNPPFTSL